MEGGAGGRRSLAGEHGARKVDIGRDSLDHMERQSHARPSDCNDQRRTRPKYTRRKEPHWSLATATTTLLAASLPATMAQNCIPLTDSSACPAFNASSISTNSNLTGLFPFLSTVTDTASFDSGLRNYIANGFTQTRYVLFQRLYAQSMLICVQISNIAWMLQRQSRQHNRILRAVHHQRALQRDRSELGTALRFDWRCHCTTVRLIMRRICAKRTGDHSQRRVRQCRL